MDTNSFLKQNNEHYEENSKKGNSAADNSNCGIRENEICEIESHHLHLQPRVLNWKCYLNFKSKM